jgi:DNA-directed RNA polymerase alpha subunit
MTRNGVPETQISDALAALEAVRRERDLSQDPFLYLTLPRPVLELPVESRGYSTRLLNTLNRNDVYTLEDLLEHRPLELLDFRLLGTGMLDTVQEDLANLGLHLADPATEPPEGDRWVQVMTSPTNYVTRLHSRLHRLDIMVLAYIPAPFALTTESYSIPWRQGIRTIGDLLDRTEAELLALPWRTHGRARVRAITRCLAYFDLTVKQPEAA